MKPAIELLAGVPSIVYGFLGVLILVAYLERSFNMLTGRSILAGSILLGIMFIPALTTICEDALRAVPREFKEGSLALGATQWQTVRHVTLPAASSGIIAAVVLNVGNIIGETMAALLVVGNVARLPSPIFDAFDRGAIQSDAPGARFNKTGNQVEQRGFPAARRCGLRNRLVCLDCRGQWCH